MSKSLEEFKNRYVSKPTDFHLWSQTEIAELWWNDELVDVTKMIEEELKEE